MLNSSPLTFTNKYQIHFTLVGENKNDLKLCNLSAYKGEIVTVAKTSISFLSNKMFNFDVICFWGM